MTARVSPGWTAGGATDVDVDTAIADALTALPEFRSGFGTVLDESVPGFLSVDGATAHCPTLLPTIVSTGGATQSMISTGDDPAIDGIEEGDALLFIASGEVANGTGSDRTVQPILRAYRGPTGAPTGLQTLTFGAITIPTGTVQQFTIIASAVVANLFGGTLFFGAGCLVSGVLGGTSGSARAAKWANAGALANPVDLAFDITATFGGAAGASLTALLHTYSIRASKLKVPAA